MKNRIIVSALAVMVVGTSLYAFGPMQGSSCFKGGHSPMSSSNKADVGMHNIMLTLSQMNLSDAQWYEIKKTMLDTSKQRLETYKDQVEFEIVIEQDGSFAKDKFIEKHNTYAKSMIETQASAIEKIFDILDDSQKLTLKNKLSK